MEKQHSYRKLFLSLLAVTMVVIFGDVGLGAILRHFYFTQRSGENFRIIQSVKYTTADVLIFGSSRSTRHYRPDILGDSLGLSYYNTGKDGQDILYSVAIGKAIFSRHKPRLILLDIRRGEFRKMPYDRLSKLLPFYKDFPEIRPFIHLRGPFERIKLISSVYPFNSELFAILITNTTINEQKRKDDRGYLPLNKQWKKPIKKESNLLFNDPLDPIRINAFRSFLLDCKKLNIPVVVVCSPYYTESLEPDSSLIVAEKTCKENNVPFLNISLNRDYQYHPELFQDVQHLNHQGALVFSSEILKEIRKMNLLN